MEAVAFATNRLHGLGMTRMEFWNSTPREMEAQINLLDRDDAIAASLLSALHNGPMIRGDKKFWKPAMFLPNYQEEKPDPKTQKAQADLQFQMMKARFAPNTKTPHQVEMERQIAHRMTRARQAQADGLSAEVIQKIMTGLA